MSTIKISRSLNGYTSISNHFIDKFLPVADGTFIKIYIYILRNSCCPDNLSLEYIAKTFDLLESDIIKALKYWHKAGVINYKCNDKTHEHEIEILDLKDSTVEYIITNTPTSNTTIKEVPNISLLKQVKLNNHPIYGLEEIAIYQEQSHDIQSLFAFAEEKLARPLKYEDLNILLGIYDWLKLPLEVIYTLIQYCVSINKTDLRYIEKVAINWCEKNIDTKEKALQMITAFDTSYKPVMKFMGISNLAENQKILIDKWVLTYKYSIRIVLKACEIAVNAKGSNISFNYIDTILSDWYKNNLKSLQEIKEYREQKIKKARDNKENKVEYLKSKPKNKFMNFPQRQYDFDAIEKMDLERNLRDAKKAGVLNEITKHS